jgi:hypothetical protein
MDVVEHPVVADVIETPFDIAFQHPLSRPRLMNIGGITAQVGRAGAETLAITRAGDLAAGAAA